MHGILNFKVDWALETGNKIAFASDSFSQGIISGGKRLMNLSVRGNNLAKTIFTSGNQFIRQSHNSMVAFLQIKYNFICLSILYLQFIGVKV